MNFIVNLENGIKIATAGKSQAALREEINELGGNIGKTSLAELLSGKRELVCGYSLVDMVDEPKTENLVVTAAAEIPAEPVVEVASPVVEKVEPAAPVSTKPSPFAALHQGADAAIAAKVNTKAKPAPAAKKAPVRIKGRNMELFTTQYPDLVAAIEKVTSIIRCAQGRILLVNGKADQKQYFHVNVLKVGFSVTEYINGKATKSSGKFADIKGVAANLKELIK